ncbi:helicase associated domain-containing protein [Streptomyces mirabilis]|uniref:helicase associated domain-containing protein n=1 Tax=Streptomyces mirabilis TaxID=68239 RepID=UPI003683AA28
MRVLNPEKVHWRRGIQAAARYLAEHDDLRVPYACRTPADWSPADFPLGAWIADCRRYYNEGTLAPERIDQLEKLGMLWSSFDASFEQGLAAAAAWAAEHHVGLAAPVDATHGDYLVGKFLSNQRAAARRAQLLAHHQAEGSNPPDSSIAPPSPTSAARHSRTSIPAGARPGPSTGSAYSGVPTTTSRTGAPSPATPTNSSSRAKTSANGPSCRHAPSVD